MDVTPKDNKINLMIGDKHHLIYDLASVLPDVDDLLESNITGVIVFAEFVTPSFAEKGINSLDVNLWMTPVRSQIKNALKDPAPAVEFVEMGQFSLNFKCKVWVDDYTQAYSTTAAATATSINSRVATIGDTPFLSFMVSTLLCFLAHLHYMLSYFYFFLHYLINV